MMEGLKEHWVCTQTTESILLACNLVFYGLFFPGLSVRQKSFDKMKRILVRAYKSHINHDDA